MEEPSKRHAKTIAKVDDLDQQDPEAVNHIEEFRQSWRDALAGKGIPIDQVWALLAED